MFRTGIIEFGNTGMTSVPCTIRNVSGTGAGLELNSTLWSNQFTLVWSDGLRKSCRVAWRKGRRMGVAFTDGPANPDEQAILMTEGEQAHQKQIGVRLRNAREARGYSHAQLANVIGISCEFVSLAETGETRMHLYQLMRIADLLRISPDWLIIGKGPTPRGVSKQESAAS
jgi:DNA-binding XRE family transcriptional regulator